MKYEDYQLELLRQVAAAYGVTYEQMSNDMARPYTHLHTEDPFKPSYEEMNMANRYRDPGDIFRQAQYEWERERAFKEEWHKPSKAEPQYTTDPKGPAGKDARCVNPDFKPTKHVFPAVELWQHPDTGTNIRMPNGRYLSDRTGAPYDLSYDWMNDRESMPADPDEIVNKYARVHHNFVRFFG